MKCLEKNRASRYTTADDLAADVQRHVENQPILAHPPSQLQRLRKLVRRRKRALVAVAALLILTPLLGLSFAWFWPGLFQHQLTVDQRVQRADQLLKNYDREGNLSRALALLQNIPGQDPSSARLWAVRGWANWLLYRENQREEAQSGKRLPRWVMW